jgi:hypothetical protein
MHAGLALFVLVRMGLRAAPPRGEQERFHMLGRTSQSAIEMLAAAEDEAAAENVNENENEHENETEPENENGEPRPNATITRGEARP